MAQNVYQPQNTSNSTKGGDELGRRERASASRGRHRALFDRVVWFVRRKLVRQLRLYVREFNVLEAKSL